MVPWHAVHQVMLAGGVRTGTRQPMVKIAGGVVEVTGDLAEKGVLPGTLLTIRVVLAALPFLQPRIGW